MLVRDKEGNYEAIDFRETAPANASEDMYRGNLAGSVYGGLSVAVPGEIRGLWYAHQKYGVSVLWPICLMLWPVCVMLWPVYIMLWPMYITPCVS